MGVFRGVPSSYLIMYLYFNFLNDLMKRIYRIFWFAVLPLILILIVFSPMSIPQHEHTSMSYNKSGDIITSSSLIKYQLDKEGFARLRIRTASIFGGVIDLPLNRVCVTLNGSDYLDIISFKPAEIYFNLDHKINLHLFETDCFYLENTYENLIWINLGYSYNESNSNLSLDTYPNYGSSPFDISIENTYLLLNNILSAFLFFLAWCVTLLLLTEVWLRIKTRG